MSRKKEEIEIFITARGMACSLGLDARQACAAARAGLSRAQELDDYPVVSPERGEPEPVQGHPLPEVTRGFEGFARRLRIAAAALADLAREAREPAFEGAGFYLSLPPPGRLSSGAALARDDETREAMEKEAGAFGDGGPDRFEAARLLEGAAELNGWSWHPVLCQVTASGHAGVAEAMRQAVADLQRGAVEVAVVGGVETLLEEETLAWLETLGRLKGPENPAGLSPGEAGAFLLLERGERASARVAPRLARVVAQVGAREGRPLLGGEPPLGDGLVQVLLETAPHAGWGHGGAVWLVVDQNGESYRALEWGLAGVRLRSVLQAFDAPVLWYPAASFGDTGAASGAVSVCVALSAFGRGYAPAPAVAVVSAADGPEREALVLSSTG